MADGNEYLDTYNARAKLKLNGQLHDVRVGTRVPGGIVTAVNHEGGVQIKGADGKLVWHGLGTAGTHVRDLPVVTTSYTTPDADKPPARVVAPVEPRVKQLSTSLAAARPAPVPEPAPVKPTRPAQVAPTYARTMQKPKTK